MKEIGILIKNRNFYKSKYQMKDTRIKDSILRMSEILKIKILLKVMKLKDFNLFLGF